LHLPAEVAVFLGKKAIQELLVKDSLSFLDV
jgi:hypothetical protein